MNPLQYAIYKGTGGRFGAIQFNFQPPHYYAGKLKSWDGNFFDSDGLKVSVYEKGQDGKRRLREGWKIREGAVFTEIAPPKDKNVYDWDQKIVMALSVNDLGKLLYFLKTGKNPDPKAEESKQLSIMHDPHAKTENQGSTKKFFNLYSENIGAGAFVTVSQTVAGDRKTHKVPLTGDEVAVLGTLTQQAISRALSW